MRTKNIQTSESFHLSALLSLSGGLQDAYTYNTRGHVFANAQTGNVVLMSQNLMLGNWLEGMRYLLPLLAFAVGIFIAERIENRYKTMKTIHWRQLVLGIETIILSIVGLLSAEWDMLANMMVSFSCAMQVQTFRTVHGYGYASTMCIGNLRSGTESLSRYLRDREPTALIKALHFFGIIFVFAVGAGLGGILSGILGIRTIWISSALLIVVILMMRKELQ